MLRPCTRFLVALLSVFAVGCTHAPHNPDEDVSYAQTHASEYFPLAVGDSWTYSGKFMGAPVSHTTTITAEKDGWFITDDNQKFMADAFGVRDELRYLLRDPVKTGAGWNNVVSVNSVEKYKILSAGQSCESAAGRFENCVVVEGRNRADPRHTLIIEWTYAPAVGWVKIATDLEGDDGRRIPQTVQELTSFKLAPKAAAK